jgi:hypothetical protein
MRCMTHTARQPDGQTSHCLKFHKLPLDVSTCNRFCFTGFTKFFWTFSIVLYAKKTRRFGNWICFRLQVKVGEKTPTQLGPLERDNLNHWTSCFLEHRTMEKVQKNVVNPVQHTPSSESFQVYRFCFVHYSSVTGRARTLISFY